MSPKQQSPSSVVILPAAVVFLFGYVVIAAPASAQEPQTADTAAVVIGDTPQPSEPAVDTTDTTLPAPLARFPQAGGAGWAAGVQVWEHEDLLRTGALNLNELLETVPGIIPVRTALQGLPQGTSSLGLGGSRVEVVLDGFILDPLRDGTLDFSRLELAYLQRVRVERRLDLLRIELESLAPSDRRPYSRIEAGTGDFDTNLFRGLFLTPRFLGGPLGLAVERVETDGGVFLEPAQTFAGWLKWGIGSSARAVEVEIRRGSVDRGDTSPLAGKGVRTDLVVRGRARPVGPLTAEAYFGQSTVDDRFVRADLGNGGFPADSVPAAVDKGRQAGLRTQLDLGSAWIRTATRHRSHEASPNLQAELEAGTRLLGWLDLSADLTWADWRAAGTGTAWSARLQSRPLGGLSALAEAVGGRRGLVLPREWVVIPDSSAEIGPWVGRLIERSGLRAGAQFERGRLQLGAAGLLLNGDSVPSLGEDLDGVAILYPTTSARGVEIAGRLPLFWQPLWLQGSWLGWQQTGGLLYLPVTEGRLALVYHHHPLANRQLEILARLEGSHRGDMRVPTREGALVILPPANQLDLYIQVRVLDVRAFLRWENILHNQRIADLPGRPLPGQRAFYGVKWHFWN